MGVLFLDCNTLVKRYVSKAGSAQVRGFLAPSPTHSTYIAMLRSCEFLSFAPLWWGQKCGFFADLVKNLHALNTHIDVRLARKPKP